MHLLYEKLMHLNLHVTAYRNIKDKHNLKESPFTDMK